MIGYVQRIGIYIERPLGMGKGWELEQRLDILTHFKDKLLRDTVPSFIKDCNGHTKEATANELKLTP